MSPRFAATKLIEDAQDTFSTPPILSGRFSHSASRQFHANVPTIKNLVNYISRVICEPTADRCKSEAGELLDADYLDIDWDSISHTLVLKAFWSKSHMQGGVWREKHNLPQGEHALEVGVLVNEKADEEEELKYSGFLTQVGKDDKPCEYQSYIRLRSRLIYNDSHGPFLFSLSPPPSSLFLNIQNHIQRTNRSPPYSSSHRPQFFLPHRPTERHLRPAHLPHSPLHPLHRPLSPLRQSHPALSQPPCPTLPQRGHRPRSTRLPHPTMGISRPLRNRHIRCASQGVQRIQLYDPAASAIHDAIFQWYTPNRRSRSCTLLGVSSRGIW